jgi:hypothetical protein
MDTSKSFAIPARLIVLDVIGALLLAIGLLKVIAGMELLPQSLRFEGYGFACMVGGVMLMVPLMVHVVVHVARGATQSASS